MDSSIAQSIQEILGDISGVVWGVPMVLIIITAGLILTITNKFMQFRGLPHSFGLISGKYDKKEHKGELTHFQALTAALAATVGIGNIAGVATAIYFGGPGAIFWMWVSALLGMAIKFTSCTLAVKYRTIDDDGNVRGGPMYFIERGLGKKARPLAIFFAACTALAALGAGNAVQSNTITDNVVALTQEYTAINPANLTIYKVMIGAGITLLAGLVILGGIKRIGLVAEKLVPGMAIIYVGSALTVLFNNTHEIIPAFSAIFSWAFTPDAAMGGAVGFTVWASLTWGMKRGIFSNEAGLGSSPMAHAAVKVDEPVREGLVAMLEPFIDTLIICTMTALVIIGSDLWIPEFVDGVRTNLNGGPLTAAAFEKGMPGFGQLMVTIGVVLFGFSTILTWSYYGEKGIEYLIGDVAKTPYKLLFLVATFSGAVFQLNLVWSFADVANALMAVPNLIGLMFLAGMVSKMGATYFADFRAGKHKPTR